jgi:DNA repair exonuclease SbcCD ATPase subunit
VSPGFGIAGWVSLLLAAFGTVAVFFTVLLAIGKRRRGPVVQVPHPAELDAEARRLLRPIRQLHERLRELESSLGDVPEFRVLAREAVQESDHLLTQAVRLTETRAGLLRVLKGRVEAESQAFRLQREIEASQDDTERASLESALAARQSEIASYDEAERTIDRIESSLREAEALLAELQARVATGAAGARAQALEPEEFGGMVERLKALGKSLDETEELMNLRQSP